jgi:L-threonylcarbamoyladenylate synthase
MKVIKMNTKIVDFKSNELIESIRKGEVDAFPTETVYGLGCIASKEEAFEAMVSVKNRRPDKPFTLMLSSPNEVEKYAEVNEKTNKLIKKYMPGEITLLLKPKAHLPHWVTLNSKYLGVRVAGKEEVCDLIARVGEPMLVTSANISGQASNADFKGTFEVFNNKIPYIVDGETKSAVPSTIVICDDEISLVREGTIKFEEIKKTWEE